MNKLINLIGKEYGQFIVIERSPNVVDNSGVTRTCWVIKCSNCGFITTRLAKFILRGVKYYCPKCEEN